MSSRIYIVGAHIPNGGTLMAYHLGLIVARHIGGEPICVNPTEELPAPTIFCYPQSIAVMGIDRLISQATADDVLIMNPSFSPLCLGLRFPGFKLMYVQGFNTFDVLDRWFDSYVSSSGFVCGFLHYVYRLAAPVIFPFIDIGGIAEKQSWADRQPERVLVLTKGHELHQNLMLEKIAEIVHRSRPDVAFERAPVGIAHTEFLRVLASYRYVLSLSCAEGFGLVPLESMALGATVVAFDGGGGDSFMRDRDNCLCTRYPDIVGLTDRLLFALSQADEAQRIAANAEISGKCFSYDRFQYHWLRHLREVLPAERVPAAVNAPQVGLPYPG